MLEVARQAGHSVTICERHYAGIFEDYDPANRTSAEAAIRAAREPGVRGMCALSDTASRGLRCKTPEIPESRRADSNR